MSIYVCLSDRLVAYWTGHHWDRTRRWVCRGPFHSRTTDNKSSLSSSDTRRDRVHDTPRLWGATGIIVEEYPKTSNRSRQGKLCGSKGLTVSKACQRKSTIVADNDKSDPATMEMSILSRSDPSHPLGVFVYTDYPIYRLNFAHQPIGKTKKLHGAFTTSLAHLQLFRNLSLVPCGVSAAKLRCAFIRIARARSWESLSCNKCPSGCVSALQRPIACKKICVLLTSKNRQRAHQYDAHGVHMCFCNSASPAEEVDGFGWLADLVHC